LPVEDGGDLRVGVVHREPADEIDGVLVGADGRWPAFDRHGEIGDGAAFEAQDEIGTPAAGVAVDGDVDLVEQGGEELFAVLVGGRGRIPDGLKVVAEREDPRAFIVGQRRRAGRLVACQGGLGGGQLGEGLFPVGFQAAGDQPVVGIDRPVATLGSARGVAGPFDLAAVLVEYGVVAVFELLGGRNLSSVVRHSRVRRSV
jgi:hypothetical protein